MLLARAPPRTMRHGAVPEAKDIKNMLSRQRLISHIVLWGFIAAGIALSFHSIDPGLVFKKSFDKWLAIFPLTVFLVYHVTSVIYYRYRIHPERLSEKRIIKKGHYGKCVHPTCTTFVILGWIIFFYRPDFRILFGVAWMTAAVFFWIHIEKSFFSGRRSQIERKKPEPV